LDARELPFLDASLYSAELVNKLARILRSLKGRRDRAFNKWWCWRTKLESDLSKDLLFI
jgi:hypothetical protein